MPAGRPRKYTTPEERRERRIAHNEYNKQWRKDNPEKRAAQSKRYNQKHKAQLAAHRRNRYQTDSEFREKLMVYQRKWQRENKERLKEYYSKYYKTHQKNVRRPRENLLRNIKRANQKILDLEYQIANRQHQIHIVKSPDRPRVKRALKNLQETLESVTAKRDNYEQLFKTNFVD